MDRHLRNCGQVRSVIEDREFAGSREALKAKRKHLRKGGKGAKKNAAEPLSAANEDKLWESGQLGDHSPQALQRTVWFYATMHFGWRGCDEHRRACYGDFRGGVSDDGREYMEFSVERGSKTRTGADPGEAQRAFHPRMFATGAIRCPVTIFRKFLEKRPLKACSPNSPMYLAVANKQTDRIWYKIQPIGVNTLGKFMKCMAEAAGISGKKTNHSAQKTMISRLVKENVNPLHVAQLSGHRNLKSLDSYSMASDEQQKAMSMIISGQQPCTSLSIAPVNHSLPSCSTAHCGQSSGNTMFPGLSVSGNNTVNIYFQQSNASQCAPPAKRRRALILSDDED